MLALKANMQTITHLNVILYFQTYRHFLYKPLLHRLFLDHDIIFYF